MCLVRAPAVQRLETSDDLVDLPPRALAHSTDGPDSNEAVALEALDREQAGRQLRWGAGLDQGAHLLDRGLNLAIVGGTPREPATFGRLDRSAE